MKKLNLKTFSGLSGAEKLLNFINENKIQQSDILKIMVFNRLHLYYYSVE